MLKRLFHSIVTKDSHSLNAAKNNDIFQMLKF